jgi:hypothetical protein
MGVLISFLTKENLQAEASIIVFVFGGNCIHFSRDGCGFVPFYRVYRLMQLIKFLIQSRDFLLFPSFILVIHYCFGQVVMTGNNILQNLFA